MIVRGSQIEGKKVENPRGGRGLLLNMGYSVLQNYTATIKMFSVVNLEADSMVGYHQHVDDMEIYLMLDGTAVVSDNGTPDILSAGDMLITNKGEYHSIENKSEQPLTFLAIIME